MMNRIVKLMLWVLFALLLISIGRTVSKIKTINQRIEGDRKEVEELERKNETLKKQLEEVSGDFYVEKQIRDKLGYSKDGEVVLILPPDEVLLKIAPRPIEEENARIEPNWRKWARLFNL